MQNQQPQHVYHQQPSATGFPPGYTYQGSQSPAINSQALAVGQPSIQHPGHQAPSATDAASQYHQLQSTAHHTASPYYRHLYPTYQQHAPPPTHPDQSHYYQTSDHHHTNPTASAVAPAPVSASSSIPTAQQPPKQQHQQHVYHQQTPSGSAQPSPSMGSNNWGTSLSSMTTPQPHHAVGTATDHSTSGYIPSYPGHNNSLADHLNSSRPLSSTSSMGPAAGLHASSYSMDPLYGASTVPDAYGYNSYNSSASYRGSTNGPHPQSGMPPSDIASFWRQGQTSHPSTQAGIPKRNAVGSEQQASTYSQDPNSYYNRSAYGQSMTGFSQPPHLPHPVQPADQHRLSAPVTGGPPPSVPQHQISQPHERLPQQQPPQQHSLHLQTQGNQSSVNQQSQFLSHPSQQGQYIPTLPSYQSTHSQQISQSQPMHQQYSPMSQLASMSRDVAVGQMLSPKKSSKVDGSESSSTSKWLDQGLSSDATMTPLTSSTYSQQSSLYSQQTPGDGSSANLAEISDPYAIDPQTFEDYEDQPLSKTKKGRPKKGENEPKKEKKPRAQRAPKNPANVAAKGKKGKSAAPQEPQVSQVVQDSLTASYPASFNYPSQESYSNNDTNIPQYITNERSQLFDQISPKISTKMTSDNLEPKPKVDNLDYQPFGEKLEQNIEPVFTNMTSNASSIIPNSLPQQDSIGLPIALQQEATSDQIKEGTIAEKPASNTENFLKTSTLTTQSPSVSPVAKSATPTGPPLYHPQVIEQSQNSTGSWKDPSAPVRTETPIANQAAPHSITDSTLETTSPTISQSIYDTQAPYGDFVSQPSISTYLKPQTTYTQPLTDVLLDEEAVPVIEQKPDERVETVSKAKKKRPKKTGEEDTKKGKKPRAPRPSKKSADSSSPSKKKKKKPKAQESQPVTTIESLSVDTNTMSNINSNDGSTFDQSQKSLNDESLLVSDKLSLSSMSVDQSEIQIEQPKPEDVDLTKKPKPPRIRDSSKKKKLPKFALKFAKTKKRKRLGSSDNEQSDLDKTPPPSPDEVESGIQKRRSARNTKKLRYNDDIELGLSDSDTETQLLLKSTAQKTTSDTIQDSSLDQSAVSVKEEPAMFAAPVEDTMVVEKILASRTGQRELEPEDGEILPPDGMFIDVEEFYCKYKNLSYLHCDWRTLEELEKGDRRVVQKLKRYKQKKDSSNMFSFMDEELFDLQYCEVDRILALNEVEEMVPDEKEEKSSQINDAVNNIEPKNLKDEKVDIPDKTNTDVTDVADISEVATPTDSTKINIPTDSTTTDTSKIDLKVDHATEGEITEKVEIESTAEESNLTEPSKRNDMDVLDSPEIKGIENSSDARAETKSEVNEDTTTIDVPEVEKPKKMKKKISRHFLVKWRGLSYEESTWELEEDLDPEKIKHFMRFKDPPPKSKWKPVKRPKPEEWVRKEASPVYKNANTLREYQLEGINWLCFCWHQGRNCILADEMGLGKTIQSITFINEIYERGIYGPFLIIVPLSTVGNWAREFENWTDLNVITYHGSSASREMLKEYEMFYRNEQGNRITSYYKFQVMITTFEIILSDCLDLREIPWRCCIIDEAHRLKNRNCKLLEGLRLLNMEQRVLLTGTPLQNNVEELFSLLNFLEPTQFDSTEQFMQEFGDLKTEAQVDKLKVILKPMMLRRLKEDVEKSLAPKEETIVEVELTNIQKKYYRAILEKNFSFLSKGGTTNSNIPNLMNTMMELRKCCIHPYLINGAEEQILFEAKQAKQNGEESLSSFQAMVNASGKLVLIDKLLPRLRADGHRVLIFSQMVRCLDILEDYVTHKHYPFERIDGRVRGSERQQAIDRFSKPGSDRFVFLLCTRAGGLGINLTAADTVIIFDSDWNPQNDLQAQARCHRIGQSKAVKIYRLICRNTYEREMFDKASLKLGLDKAVLQSMNTQKNAGGGIDGQLTKKEIEELLRKGAYGAIMDDDNAGDKFCEEDIDQILLRRTQVITIDNSEAKGSTFSKATFSSSNNREDIDIDDPNFWEKWAKKANLDADDLLNKDELIVSEPRRRTQTKRFGADGSMIEISDFESTDEDEETISMRTRGQRGRTTKTTPMSNSKRSKRHRFLDDYDDDSMGKSEVGQWSKSECFKVEKGLLTYGWGRWQEIIAKANFKREISVEDCENLARVMLLYCLNSYKGDDKIKSFIWELISPSEDEAEKQELDSSFPSRGRKSKLSSLAVKKSIIEEMIDAKWLRDPRFNPQDYLTDDQYKKHLIRNSNRLLLRVKFLHYLKTDVLKDHQDSTEIELPALTVDGDAPVSWWDEEADKSLLIGVYKHGYDKFTSIRQDPQLCFLAKCGPPSKSELFAELNYIEDPNKSVDDDECDNNKDSLLSNIDQESIQLVKGQGDKTIAPRDSAAREILEEIIDSIANDDSRGESILVDENKNSINKKFSLNGISDNDVVMTDESLSNGIIEKVSNVDYEMEVDNTRLPFPSANDFNQRFRRLIMAHQRNSKRIELQMAQKARDELKKERTSKFEAAKNEREERKRSQAQKWSRREEADFFRAISSYGVEYDPASCKHDWNKFRSIGKLEKKLDDTMDEYYKAFVAMCKRVTSRPLTDDDSKSEIKVEPITEERAIKCLSRIEFLSKIREKIIDHPEFEQRLLLCQSTSELPDWWINVKHDRDLLLAAARIGLSRLDYNLAHDPSYSLADVIKQKALSLLEQPQTPIIISIETLEELLNANGIKCEKDFNEDQDSEYDEVKLVLDALIDSVERSDDSHDKFLTTNMYATRASPKATRSSTTGSSMRLPSTISKRGSSIVILKLKSIGPNSTEVLLTSSNPDKHVDNKFIEVIPLPPSELPEEISKSFEAGEVTITVQCKSALVQSTNGAPVLLQGTDFQISSKLRWPKDKNIQSRLENLVYMIDKNEWPTPAKLSAVPTITLPPHMTPVMNTVQPSSTPLPKEKVDVPLASPTSDISSVSSRSKPGVRDTTEVRGSTRRGRGRRSKVESQPPPPPIDEGQAAKLRNLLSQGSSKNSQQGEKLSAKFGGNKPNVELSSLLASLKQKKGETSGRSRNDPSAFDMSLMKNPNLLPLFANMKPELRDLLANKDTAAMLYNSLSSISGGAVPNLGTSSSSASSPAASNQKASSSRGPPPAHQGPQDHGPRESRRNTNPDAPQTSLNLRSMRGKSSPIYPENTKSTDNSKQLPSRRRGRPSSSASNDTPTGASSVDVLDLSSLQQFSRTNNSSRLDSRLRRGRGSIDDLTTELETAKLSFKSSSRHANVTQEDETSSDAANTRTTRASKRISRIDALALNLQAKKMNTEDTSPSAAQEQPQSPNRGRRSQSNVSGSSSSKTSEQRNPSRGPPMAHSQASGKSTSDQQKDTQMASRSLLNNNSTSGSRQQQNPVSQMPLNANPPLFGNLNPAGLGNHTDLINQLLRSSSDPSKNFLSDPNLLSTLTNLISMNPNLLSSFGSTTSATPQVSLNNSTAGVTNKQSSSMDFKTPPVNQGVDNSVHSKSRSRQNDSSSIENSDSKKSLDRERRQASQSNEKRSNQDKSRRGGVLPETDNQSRRSSSSLLAQQTAPTSQQITGQSQTSSSVQSNLPNSSATLNLANHFGGLNPLGLLAGFPNMSDLMKQMGSSFPGLSCLTPSASSSIPSPATYTNSNSSAERPNKRAKNSATTSSTSSASSTSQQTNPNLSMAFANSLMNLAPTNSGTNPYSYNPLTNPFLFGPLGNFNMNLFSNPYMPGFPPTTDQQSQPTSQSNPNTSSSGSTNYNSSSKDKKMRYSRK